MYIYLVKVAVTSTGKKEKKLRPRNDEHLAQPGDPEMPSTLNSGGPRNAEYGLNLGDPEMPSTLNSGGPEMPSTGLIWETPKCRALCQFGGTPSTCFIWWDPETPSTW